MVALIASSVAVLILGAPVTAVLGPRYVMATMRRRPRPRHHALTCAAILLVAAASALAVSCGATLLRAYDAWAHPIR